MIYTIRRAEKGFSKKIVLLFAVLCPNRIRVQLINCTRVIKTGFYVPSCKLLPVVYSRARARTIIIIIIMVCTKSQYVQICCRGRTIIVNNIHYLLSSESYAIWQQYNIIIVGCNFCIFYTTMAASRRLKVLVLGPILYIYDWAYYIWSTYPNVLYCTICTLNILKRRLCQ